VTGRELLDYFNSREAAKLFSSLYGEDGIEGSRQRYRRLVEELIENFSKADFPETSGELRVFSVPGRTELGGNHTDHNRGKVLAASIQLDAVAVVAKRQDNKIFFRSEGHRDVTLDISNLAVVEEEKGETEALIRGVAAELAARFSPVGGFSANASNMVLSGSGLSSSAAVEVLFAKIFDSLYAGGKRDALELAKIGQKAENVYFGKPCGLMDQTACASGGAVAIDFEDPSNPKLKGIGFDPAACGFVLCIVNTRARHSDLTPDYAAIPAEMKAIAAFFGKASLRELDEETLMSCLEELRKGPGDRAVLRALHFFGENRRVDEMLAALETIAQEADKTGAKAQGAMDEFLALVGESGDSSSELLQNIYSVKNPAEQGIGLALALSKKFLGGKGACRVHGGGFAGTIQAYIPDKRLDDYIKLMEGVFGSGTVTVLRIRSSGVTELDFPVQ